MKISPKFVAFSAAVAICGYASSAFAEDLKSARVTQVVKDVKLLPANAAARAATTSDDVKRGTAVRTGVDSRAELTFTDLTLTRLGANTVFSFDEGTRELNLGSGAILVQVPRNAPAAKVTTAAVTAAITGGTSLMEFHKGSTSKLVILEGTGKLCSKTSGQCEEAGGGHMIMADAKGNVFKPVEIKDDKVVKSSKLIVGFKPLQNLDLINDVIQQQLTGGSNLDNSGPNNNSGANDVISQRTASSISQPPQFVCPFGH